MTATLPLTTAQVAEKFETDGRTLRKFLRSDAGMNSKVGKGKRWAIDSKQLPALRKQFIAWAEARAAATADAPEGDEG